MEFDINYITKKVIKWRAVAEFLAQQLIKGEQYKFEFSDESIKAISIRNLRMYFDGAVNYKRPEIVGIIVTPKGEILPQVKRLTFSVIDNIAQYEACTFGLEALVTLVVKETEVYRDSMLFIQQIRGD